MAITVIKTTFLPSNICPCKTNLCGFKYFFYLISSSLHMLTDITPEYKKDCLVIFLGL